MRSPDNRPPMRGKDYLAMTVCYGMIGWLFWVFRDHIKFLLYTTGVL